jgi:uncharacterized protein
MKKYIATILIALLAMQSDANTNTAGKFISVGTGNVTGVYYPAGGAICRFVNRGRRQHGIRCSVESTSGSIYNINALRSGELEVAMTQSDWQYNAYHGTSVFADQGAFKNMRALFSLHSEPFTMIVRKDSGIKTLDDIKGQRVNMGDPSSGMRAIMELIFQKKGWKKSDFKMISELKGSEQAQALCDEKLDVMVYAAGHPNGAVQEATSMCDTEILSLDDSIIKDLIAENPYYAEATIPGGMYSGNPKDIKTFGVTATLVTTTDVDADIIYQLVKSTFDNFEDFKQLHPVFNHLDIETLATNGVTAPLHDGAKKYFLEKGLIKNPEAPKRKGGDTKGATKKQ